MKIDTHVHFYDPSRPQGVPWPKADNELLYRTVLPGDYTPLAKEIGVDGVVVVEASPWLDDNQWILDLAETEPMILGFVGNLDFNSDDFEKNIDQFSQQRYFNGLRKGNVTSQDLDNPRFLSRIRNVVDAGLSLDLLARPGDLPAVAELAERFDGLRIILDHATHVPVTSDLPGEQWLRDVRALKQFPEVYCKISGLTESAGDQMPRGGNIPLDPAFYRPYLEELFNVFGSDRLLFATNWPVVDRATSVQDMTNVVKPFIETLGPETAEKIYSGNAVNAYRLA